MNDGVYRVGVTANSRIEGPAHIQLVADGKDHFLKWALRRDGLSSDSSPLKEHPHEGCLKAFRHLAKGNAPQMLSGEVLNFAKRWGVLGVDPYVRDQQAPDDYWGATEMNRGSELVQYSEPVSIYFQLASILDSILTVNRKIRAGEWDRIAPRDIYTPSSGYSKADYLAVGFVRLAEMRKSGASGNDLYRQLGLLVSYLGPLHSPLLLHGSDPKREAHIGISFGFWSDGCAWDRQKAAHCQQWEKYVKGSPLTKGVPPARSWLPGLNNARPSALYAVLMFHLIMEMLRAEGIYACHRCGKDCPSARKPRNGIALCKNPDSPTGNPLTRCQLEQNAKNAASRRGKRSKDEAV